MAVVSGYIVHMLLEIINVLQKRGAELKCVDDLHGVDDAKTGTADDRPSFTQVSEFILSYIPLLHLSCHLEYLLLQSDTPLSDSIPRRLPHHRHARADGLDA